MNPVQQQCRNSIYIHIEDENNSENIQIVKKINEEFADLKNNINQETEFYESKTKQTNFIERQNTLSVGSDNVNNSLTNVIHKEIDDMQENIIKTNNVKSYSTLENDEINHLSYDKKILEETINQEDKLIKNENSHLLNQQSIENVQLKLKINKKPVNFLNENSPLESNAKRRSLSFYFSKTPNEEKTFKLYNFLKVAIFILIIIALIYIIFLIFILFNKKEEIIREFNQIYNK